MRSILLEDLERYFHGHVSETCDFVGDTLQLFLVQIAEDGGGSILAENCQQDCGLSCAAQFELFHPRAHGASFFSQARTASVLLSAQLRRTGGSRFLRIWDCAERLAACSLASKASGFPPSEIPAASGAGGGAARGAFLDGSKHQHVDHQEKDRNSRIANDGRIFVDSVAGSTDEGADADGQSAATGCSKLRF